ncbi:MAG: hypothetical protein ACTMUB_04110 [cyanobacterium endosymbiont of Rhopalodia musculus]|uniref:hypothetical protein n=1 Tax=cyanobacterium endosymbiont of Epithemia clementina EcSB TaxID=3034674 RepID=UPI00247FEE50|nr:hypothetical protein [cyanobacterium endosymbiont of Epithemia clementina EcSB]WGT67370.1 hypothetical protein P3F56_09250 [cyanobacterium endosymbiont of Epithemia clementina EcSB]
MSSHFPLTFRISPLIRITLISLYFSLTLPLPFLADITSASVPPLMLWTGIVMGFIVLVGALSERVIVDEDTIKVTYPSWIPSFFRKGWSLPWSKIKDLKSRTTGQGGLVYYFVSLDAQTAFLLPMRIAGFSRLVNIVTEKTGIDTTDIRPLSQPWMYLVLLVLTSFLMIVDGWTIATAIGMGR